MIQAARIHQSIEAEVFQEDVSALSKSLPSGWVPLPGHQELCQFARQVQAASLGEATPQTSATPPHTHTVKP